MVPVFRAQPEADKDYDRALVLETESICWSAERAGPVRRRS